MEHACLCSALLDSSSQPSSRLQSDHSWVTSGILGMFADNRTFNIATYADHLRRQQNNRRATARRRQDFAGSSSQSQARSNEDGGTLAGERRVPPHQETCSHVHSRLNSAGLLTTPTETLASMSSLEASRSQTTRSSHTNSRSGTESLKTSTPRLFTVVFIVVVKSSLALDTSVEPAYSHHNFANHVALSTPLDMRSCFAKDLSRRLKNHLLRTIALIPG